MLDYGPLVPPEPHNSNILSLLSAALWSDDCVSLAPPNFGKRRQFIHEASLCDWRRYLALRTISFQRHGYDVQGCCELYPDTASFLGMTVPQSSRLLSPAGRLISIHGLLLPSPRIRRH